MPHPHEQKLHEVVNSAISVSFMVRAAASSAGQWSNPPTARPAPPPTVIFSASLRLKRLSLDALTSPPGSPARAGFGGPVQTARHRSEATPTGSSAAVAEVSGRRSRQEPGRPPKYRG